LASFETDASNAVKYAIALGYRQRAAVVTSCITPSGVFCQELPRETGSAEFPFGRQWAASVPSAGASLK
jgi:hypothetical protein